MHLDEFDYQLPEELIAQYPLPQRTASRLFHLKRQDQAFEHLMFNDLHQLIQPNDCLIFNDTRVIPARLYGSKSTGGKIEILIERITSVHTALTHIRASKSPKVGSTIALMEEVKLKVIGRQDELFIIQCEENLSLIDLLIQQGHVPIPTYVTRQDEAIDHERYQTVYARAPGAVAAPTAGLHFDQLFLTRLKQRGIQMGFVTLHVGAGTFKPVRVTDIREHKMHSEYLIVPEQTCKLIEQCKLNGGRVIAVGTTAVRALETAMQTGELQPFQGDTQIFLYPGYQFQSVDAMITNFHLPKSTLLMLISAFAGHQLTMQAYQEAIAERYRFFSYGDAMFIS